MKDRGSQIDIVEIHVVDGMILFDGPAGTVMTLAVDAAAAIAEQLNRAVAEVRGRQP